MNNSSLCRVVVLIGGNGSNLQALIDRQQMAGAAFQIVGVISHQKEAYGLIRAKNAGISTTVVAHQDYSDRDSFEQALLDALRVYRPDLIALAGFMRILSAEFVKPYLGKILNIHPSLLPRYKGLHTHERVLAAKELEHGASVHFVTDSLDGGPIVAQMKMAIQQHDTLESLKTRVFQLEHFLYPTVVQWFAEDRLRYSEKDLTLDNQQLGEQGYFLSLSNRGDIVP